MSCSCDGLAGSLAISFRLARLRQAMEATGADSWASRLMAVGWLMLAWLGTGDWSWRGASLKANPPGEKKEKNAAQPMWLDRPAWIWICRAHPLGLH
jgi:hypothetical protein